MIGYFLPSPGQEGNGELLETGACHLSRLRDSGGVLKMSDKESKGKKVRTEERGQLISLLGIGFTKSLHGVQTGLAGY